MPERAYLWPRQSGISLHITALPGRWGIGDLGPKAYEFVDWLSEAGQSVWHILPLGPTGYGDSPYAGFSVFAGNPLLVSLDQLTVSGWLSEAELGDLPEAPADRVDFEPTINFHKSALKRAYSNFKAHAVERDRSAFLSWCARELDWLDDFALFMTLKELHGGDAYSRWDLAYASHEYDALRSLELIYPTDIEMHKFVQWLFDTQWQALRRYANARGVRFLGEVPLYVAVDSADAWANPHLFLLTDLQPTVVAGIPPDYYSPTGQLWGNPIYNWHQHEESNFDWWQRRLRKEAERVDYCHLLSFSQLESYWEVPAGHTTAEAGHWAKGPGQAFFDALLTGLPELKISVDDRTPVRPEIETLRDNNGLPGMVLLPYASWTDMDGHDDFLPHNHRVHQVIHLGHPLLPTIAPWWRTMAEDTRTAFLSYISASEVSIEPQWELVRLAMLSVGHTCLVALQDLLGYDPDGSRMSARGLFRPWDWRMTEDQWRSIPSGRLLEWTERTGRAQRNASNK